VIELATELDLVVHERPIEYDELLAARELFLTSSLRAIAPAVRIDGRSVGDGKPGPLTRCTMEAYAALVSRECGA